MKLLAYVFGAMAGAAAGPLNAAQFGTVDPSSFTFLTSLMILLMMILLMMITAGWTPGRAS
ncbi:hypothetical protein [Actinomadura sp. BRA 177]|uniref:hypothetical protein n=1 Tax=Actinomadura sp. BRA 177 TaxID=2745202 RepID=UPI0015954862|nr:hypothetical protein [Actinomadura sp. BRA 177]NVI92845.1 hypothetical protein [Actinomadura sp. BRA 177]